MLSVIFYLCCVGLFITLSLAGPVFVALLGGDLEIAKRFSIYLLVGGFLFGAPVLATIGRQRRVPQIGGLFLLVLVWTIMPLMGAIPILDILDIKFIDALFESVSGLTTTGSTTFVNVDALPRAVAFWRVQLQWIGGFLALITVFGILAPIGVGGLSLSAISRRGHGGSMAARSRLLTLIWNYGLFYLAVTIAAFLVFSFSGVRAYYAATLAMAAISTGGFLPFNASVDQILGPFGLLCFAGVLLLGATSVFWHRMVLERNVARLREHRESYSVILLALLLGFAFALTITVVSGGASQVAGQALIEGVVNGASLVATSGVESRPGVFTLFPLPLVLFIVLLGGSAFSTSGGLKHYRVGAMIVQSWSELDRLIYPNAVRPSRFGTQRFDLQLMKAIWSFFVIAILTIAAGTIVVSTAGMPFSAALTATVSSFATAGPVYASGWATSGADVWPAYGAFADSGKWALMVVMLLGRLEVLAVLGLFSTHYWRNR